MMKKAWSQLLKSVGLSRRDLDETKWKRALEGVTDRIDHLKQEREEEMEQLRRKIVRCLQMGESREEHALVLAGYLIKEKEEGEAHETIKDCCQTIDAYIVKLKWQRKCPVEIRAQVESLSYASRKCLDIPQLRTVKKIFDNYFGKDFVAASDKKLEHVPVELFRKLSSQPPSLERKLAKLRNIAEENNIDWTYSKEEAGE